MKALLCEQFAEVERLTVRDIEPLRAGQGQVRVSIYAASLNYPDALMVQGLYQAKPALPFVPGSEYAGVVVEAGAGVTAFKPGDRVIAFGSLGGFAEEGVVDASRVAHLPAEMDFDVGAALVVAYCTTLRGLKDCAHMQPGETLLVLGAAGGVGLAAVEIGKAMGARVIAAASTADKLALCREHGADELINYATENLRERLNELTQGRGVDVVYDPVGGPYTELAFRSTGWRGRLVVVGFAAGDIPKLPVNLCLLRERTLIGVFWGDSLKHDPQSQDRNLAQLMQWIAEGKIKPHIDERVPLAQTPQLMKRMLARSVKGKVVVLPQA
ncbi:MAG: NADPH:quinone oxidoreductase family protein [Burkholderiales bacterium]